jgi:creatinine amidohydrolase/Fe(II)-dependent formamide hydrolase-like protein
MTISPKKTPGQKVGGPSELEVFDQLVVGPVRLESHRLVMPYRLFINSSPFDTELIYKYEEKVFEPDRLESMNLATMIGLQVALNYGLFCRQIICRGHIDSIDQQLIRVMMENTSREIYVKKFLEPNPFLNKNSKPVPAEARQVYTRAEILFPDAAQSSDHDNWRVWPVDKRIICVLSSGGKDSLLSYGLLEEISAKTGYRPVKEVHAIFCNESGRHWLTALNAYRHFRDHVPHTSRVWQNSDRVFAWFLRHMPFIRKDFNDLRSDEYPIRLWTVAVFLFGVLPVLKKRGIGRLVIGDEFDTTVKTQRDGIDHYDGLYDQSRFFDEALSRYFLQKGWMVSQFSILRPLSEMLIEKTLMQRYPDLLKLQMSCHAAHKEGEWVKPCGRCEKCRRIVGMLLALGQSPQVCGYSDYQVTYCLNKLTEKGVHQEADGIFHLVYMLNKQGAIQLDSSSKLVASPHPEILCLRIDTERSPFKTIPVALRFPLLKIFLQHADGIMLKKGNKWISVTPTAELVLNEPYPFELNFDEIENTQMSGTKTPSVMWGESSWPQAKERLKAVDIALLPVGAIEQHGPHLPLDTDAFDAQYLAVHTAQACSDPKPYVLPLIPFGVSYHHDDFSGTVSISNETLSSLVYDIGMSIAAHGIRKLVIINGHGGNGPALNYAAQKINRDARIFVCVDTGETSDVDIGSIVKTHNDVHAGEIETSATLAVRPQLVDMAMAKKSIPRFSSHYLDFSSKRGVSWYAYTRRISVTGIMGDPTLATVEKGKRIWATMIAHMVAFVEDLKRLTLDEIHQKRY